MKRNIRDLGTFETPIGGMRGNVLNPGSWLKGILGVVFLGAVIVVGLLIVGRIMRALNVDRPEAAAVMREIF